MQRTLVLDALRMELVQTLARKLSEDQQALASWTQSQRQRLRESEPDLEANNGSEIPNDIPSAPTKSNAQQTQRRMREYLPQLVSAVLKSPAAFDPGLANPIQKLRALILRQCSQDPSVGIELCWLLEAEVGRDWKTLFEHKQQTGKRLIIVLPAEKAAILAKIGSEKKEAFDLLQDAEQATAYGYSEEEMKSIDETHGTERLPSSLSLKRCSHFGDTMHFIDRLTKISSELRGVPEQHRTDYLHHHLHELNRRIRRRMVTRGDISLDVEDHHKSYEWPQIGDLSLDMIQHSVHLPLVPQSGTWPDGSDITPAKSLNKNSDEVVRVLNIAVSESRILASRERCPYLIHVEVADSGYEGRDARLYASGATEIGATIGETLGMGNIQSNSHTSSENVYENERPTYGVPDELLQTPGSREYYSENGYPANGQMESETHSSSSSNGILENAALVSRGGSEGQYFEDNQDGVTYDPFDARQHEVEQLHNHLYYQEPTREPYLPQSQPHIPRLTMGNRLLNQVFGRPWIETCKEIRAESPFGNVKGWRLASFILKAGEDIRREAFVMQMITKLKKWFEEEIPEPHRPFLNPYTIMCVGGDAGLVECLSDAKSVDELKKRTDGFVSLRDYFERAYGPPGSHFVHSPGQNGKLHQHTHHNHVNAHHENDWNPHTETISFDTAQDNFLRSLVGYSLVCYIAQVKDRHNANILMDRLGHIMHIDFGFVLGDTPKMGKVPLFSERAPFKLSKEFWDVLGGWDTRQGGLGVKFCKMLELAFECASRHSDELAALTEATMLSLNSSPAIARATAQGVRSRLRMRGPPGSVAQINFILDRVNAAQTSWGTSTYDWLQRSMNGYQ